MSAGGHFCWPPLGSSYWPLTGKGVELGELSLRLRPE